MKMITLTAIAAVAIAFAGSANAQEALAKSSGCLNCHDVNTKKIGPSFKSVAAKFKGKAGAEAELVAQLSSGKGHPSVKAKGDDLNSLVKWVLSQ